jgi:hypothetical protein
VAKTLRQLQEIFDLRAVLCDDGKYQLTATPRNGYGQPFWFSDFHYPTPDDAMRAPELYGPCGPGC